MTLNESATVDDSSCSAQQEDNEVLHLEPLKNVIFDQKVVEKSYKWEIHWTHSTILALVHVFGAYGLVLLCQAQLATIYWFFALITLAQLGSQAGAHRLWSHRSFKANLGARWFLSICHVMAFQKNLLDWARDHRVHHKYTDTDADPHNATRGFFFSHVGWALVKKNPLTTQKGLELDCSDLYADPVVMFQSKYFVEMAIVFYLALPVAIPVYFWHENWVIAITICVALRHAYTLNTTFLINSWAHMFGSRPYDHRIAPVECSIRHWLFGEGFHNYHHAFPWDYSASELGALDVFNPATAVIDFMHWAGWAWDLKKVKPSMVQSRKCKTGDEGFCYKTNRTYYEYFSGMFTVFGPFLLIRYIPMMFSYFRSSY